MTLIDVNGLGGAADASVVVFAASAVGRSHRRTGRGGQDAWAADRSGDLVAFAVADGCSAGGRSEIGAGLGARFVVADALRRAANGTPLEDIPRLVVDALVAELAHLARALSATGATVGDGVERAHRGGGCPTDARASSTSASAPWTSAGSVSTSAVSTKFDGRVVEEHLLFTVQAALIDGPRAIVFGVGDGVVSVDGRVAVIDEGPAPDYPAYALFADGPDAMRAPRLRVHHDGAFDSVALGSDGVAELIAAQGATLADGSALGGLAILESDARFVRNTSLAQKRFHAWCASGGPVDDCTVVVARRTR